MQKQVTLMEKEITQRLRAWLGIPAGFAPAFVSIHGGAKIDYDTFVKSYSDRVIEIVWFVGEIKNYGALPARDIRGNIRISDNRPTRQDIKKLELIPYQSLMPQASGQLNFEISGERWSQLRAGKSLFILLHMEYSYSDNERDSFGYIWQIRVEGGLLLEESW